MAWRRDQVPTYSPEYKHYSPNRCSNMQYHIFTEYETRDLKPVLNPNPMESRPHSPLVQEILSPKFDSEDSIRQRSCGINTRLRAPTARLSPDRSTSMSGRVVNPYDCKAVSPIASIINTVNAAVSPIKMACPTLRTNSFKRILVSSSKAPANNIEKPLIANNSSQWEWPSRLSQPIRPINTLRSRSQSRTRYSLPRTKSEAVRTTSSLRTATEPIGPIDKSEIPNVTIIPGPQRRKMDWDNYHRLDTINNFLEELEFEFPALCTVGEIGKSLEGRPIKVLKISNSNANNPSVWVDAGIHAREWIGPAVNTFVANHIARNFNNLPPSVTEKDWYFLPVANPDGYEFTHTGDRMWRKNRAKNGGKYFGVDLNRNFSYNWGGKGSSDRTTHCFYRGPAPFSEPESCAIRDMIQYSGARFLIYITLHSFGQVIIFPFASEDDLCPDYIRLLEGATVMSKAIFETNGNTYKVGLSKDVMYRASGTSNDWCYGTCGIPYCYLIELRSKKHRFMLPHEEIRESGVEILNCLLALVEFVDSRPLGEKSKVTIKVAPTNEKFQVWEVKVDKEGQRFFIKNLDSSGAINIWKEHLSTMDIMVQSSHAAQVAGMLYDQDIPYSIAIGDVAVLMEKECPRRNSSKTLQGVKMDWTRYHRLATINAFMENLAKEFPFLCTVNVIGHTHEGRDMMMLKISNGNASNPGVWMDATIHAREWISAAVVTYMADQIARKFHTLPDSVTSKDWYILPVLNPDGYEYTHTQDRMWRKNRRKYGECVGVDLNRNWSKGWGEKGEEGSSDDPGSIFYRGPEPFSELETEAVQRVILKSSTKFLVFLSFHSYGEVIIFPWGYTSDPCPDYVKLLEGGTAMAKAIHATSGHTYKVGSTKDLMYYASGTSVDWSYGTARIPYSYMVELRGKKHKFLLPKEDILPTSIEVFNGVLRLVDFVDGADVTARRTCSMT